MTNYHKNNIGIIGAGNLGKAIAKGLVKSGNYLPENITLTRKNLTELIPYQNNGFSITDNNLSAVETNDVIIISVGPQDTEQVLDSINAKLNPDKHILISTITGVSIKKIQSLVSLKIPVVRIMPNIAVAICESMTCIASTDEDSKYLLGIIPLLKQ